MLEAAMTGPETKGTKMKMNGNFKTLLLIFLVVAQTGFIVIKDIVLPSIPSTSKTVELRLGNIEGNLQNVVAREKRFDSIDDQLRNLETTAATNKEAIAGLKTAIERLERKMDQHISKLP